MSLEWHYTLFIRSWNDLFICTSMYFSFKPIFSSLRDVVTQVWLMMTHRSSEHQSSGAGFTWQDTQHHRSQSLGPGHRHSHLKLECHVKTTSRRPWGARNPKRRLQCSFRVSLHFSPAQAAVGRSSEPHSGLAHSDNGYNSNIETRRRSGAQWYSDEMIQWGYQGDMCGQRLGPHSACDHQRCARFLCCIVSWALGQACLVPSATGPSSTICDRASVEIISLLPGVKLQLIRITLKSKQKIYFWCIFIL